MSLNIGHFVIRFPSIKEKLQVYGSERITYTLCSELVNLGNNIDVFVPYIKTFDESVNNIHVHFYKSIASILGYNISLRMLKKVMKFKLDIVHVHNDSPMAMLAGMCYAKKKKKPLVVTWHGDWLGATKLRKLSATVLNKLLVRKCLLYASAVIVPSISYLETSNVLGEFEHKVVEIPHGVNINSLQIPYSKEESREILNLENDAFIVLYLGAVCKDKGVGLLLKAAHNVLKNYRNIRFIFVGGGEINKFKELARNIGIERYIKFTGYVDENMKLHYYNSADIFVFPSMSKHETFGIVTTEAAVFGLPIIVSDLRIFKNRIKDKYNGVCFRPRDENNLAKAIVYLLENEKLREKIGRNIRKDIEKYYNSKRMAKLTYKLYESVI